jgi:two-component system, OmpR family, response regulator MprA
VRVLIVDDDPDLRRLLVIELSAAGYSCTEAATGTQALALASTSPGDVVVLDWTLPDVSGVEVCRRLRADGIGTPVLMLTARDDVSERVEALDAGADDYLTKPFSVEELLARLRAQLRRGDLQPGGADERLRHGPLLLDPASREVRLNGTREYTLLEVLLRHAEQVMTRQDLLAAVWGDPFDGDPSLLDAYVRYLRRKLEPPGAVSLIQTVRGVGFMLREGPPRS